MWADRMATKLGDFVATRVAKYQPPSLWERYATGVLLVCVVASLYVELRFPGTSSQAIGDCLTMVVFAFPVIWARGKITRVMACLLYWLFTTFMLSAVVFKVALFVGIALSIFTLYAILDVWGFLSRRQKLV